MHNKELKYLSDTKYEKPSNSTIYISLFYSMFGYRFLSGNNDEKG